MRILVVEDEASNMQILALSLRHRGHEVIEACDPESGLAFALSEAPDLILMDLHFKGASFDGLEAIRRLKADPRTAGIPVVAQTASVLDYGELSVSGAGADGYLRKPFRRQELLTALDQALNRGRAGHRPPPPGQA